MFEFEKYEKHRKSRTAQPTAPYEAFDGAGRRAFLLWGEHCTECAAPDCFATCDLYDARPDMRCRRFEYGVFKNKAFHSAAGYGAEVVFKRWGKIEARGNATLMSPGSVRRLELCASAAAPVLDRVGALAGRVTRDIRWSYLNHSLMERFNGWLRRRGDPADLPDAFIAEIYNPGEAEVVLLLAMAVDRTKLEPNTRPDQLPAPVIERIAVPPGYFRLDLPRERFAQLVGSGLPFGITITPEGAEGAHLVFLSLDFVSYRQEPADTSGAPEAGAPRPDAKCVVFDLDNTLWDGILLEGEVMLRPGVVDTMRRLDARGILISVASKNAPADALAKLRSFGIEEYLVQPVIGWGAKSDSLRQVAKRLNIGLDSLIFIDDNLFERDEVSRALPEVEVLADTALPGLADHPRLQGKVTEESRARRLMYRESMVRESAAAEFGSDYVEFLRSCAIQVEVRPDRPEDAERIAELVQRTNQLNFSGRKYRREELEPILSDEGIERYVVSCSDRYGAYGIIGFCLVRRIGDGLRIEDLMLSCRVQGKFVEKALLHHLCSRPSWSARFVEISFRPTERNAAARAVLTELGFPSPGEALLRLDIAPGQFEPGFIAVTGAYPQAAAQA